MEWKNLGRLACVAGAVAATVLGAVALVALLAGFGRFLTWSLESGLAPWLFEGKTWLFGVSPIWAFWAAFMAALFAGRPAYRACQGHRAQRRLRQAQGRVNGEGGAA